MKAPADPLGRRFDEETIPGVIEMILLDSTINLPLINSYTTTWRVLRRMSVIFREYLDVCLSFLSWECFQWRSLNITVRPFAINRKTRRVSSQNPFIGVAYFYCPCGWPAASDTRRRDCLFPPHFPALFPAEPRVDIGPQLSRSEQSYVRVLMFM